MQNLTSWQGLRWQRHGLLGARQKEGEPEVEGRVSLPPRYWAAFALSGDWQ